MAKSMIDPDALIEMFESATAKQGAQLRALFGGGGLEHFDQRVGIDHRLVHCSLLCRGLHALTLAPVGQAGHITKGL